MANENDQDLPTLDSIGLVMPRVNRHELGNMIIRMQQSGFYSWGFVIYRGTFSDDNAWGRYVKYAKEEVHDGLVLFKQERLLTQYLEWTIIEDRTLENVPKETVRQKFRDWVSQSSEERDGHGWNHPITKGIIPRFSYCIYVDQKCLDWLPKFEAGPRRDPYSMPNYLPMVLIDAKCDAQGHGEGGLPDVEGCTKAYTGYMYADFVAMPELYNIMGSCGMEEGYSYCRPPLLYPGHNQGVTVD